MILNVKIWPKICHLGPSKFSLSWCQKQEKLDSTRLKLVVLHYTFVICILSEHIILIIILYSFKTGTVMDFGIIKPVSKISSYEFKEMHIPDARPKDGLPASLTQQFNFHPLHVDGTRTQIHNSLYH